MKPIFAALACVSILAFTGCAPDRQLPAGERLAALVAEWHEQTLERHPLGATYAGDDRYNDRLPNYLSPGFIAEERARNARFLQVARAIDPAELDEADRITLAVFLYDRELQREAERFPAELLPLNQFFSIQNEFPSLGSGRSAQPFKTVQDYRNWVKRVEDFAVLLAQAEANMREGMKRQVVLPRVLVERMLPQLQAHIVGAVEDSLFWQPVENFPADFDAEQRQALRELYARMITDTVVPAYRRLHDFLRDEYLAAARASYGFDALPDGKAWYRHMIRRHTTLDLDPAELHRLGLAHVQRNLDEMRAVMRQSGFEGSLQEWFAFLRDDPRFHAESEAALLDGYRAIEARVNAVIPRLFDVQPRAGFEVRAIESYRAASSAGAFYQSPSQDGKRPGAFYVNTHNLKAQPWHGMRTLFMHEAIPGHHFQVSLQQEQADLPAFRRQGRYSAYTEGWALYAESLGKELGLYDDPMDWYGHVEADQLRALRLVVDTGLHSRGWSREQAIEFMLANSSMAESDAIAEVERYMAFPAQALAFKVGQLKIRELRERAAQALGEDFDVRDFHRQVLRSAVPLPILEDVIERWIEQQRDRG